MGRRGDSKQVTKRRVGDGQQGGGAVDAGRRARSRQEQYEEFYKQISYDTEAPLAYTHNRVEGRTEYTQLLYIPAKAPFDLWNRDKRGGVKLYVKRVFIMDDAEALMPVLPALRQGRDRLGRPAAQRQPRAAAGKPRREGDPRRLDQARAGACSRRWPTARTRRRRTSTRRSGRTSASCSRKASARTSPTASASPSCCASRRRTTDAASACRCADYVGRMKEGQEAIYYITADTLAAAKNSPQLEIFRKKGIEVLLLDRPRRRVDALAPVRVRRHAAAERRQGRGRPRQAAGRGREEAGRGSRRRPSSRCSSG